MKNDSKVEAKSRPESSNMPSVQVAERTTMRAKVGLILGMPAAFLVGMALVVQMPLLKQDLPVSEPIVVISDDTLPHLTAIVVKSAAAGDVVNVRQKIFDLGGTVPVTISEYVKGSAVGDEYIILASIDPQSLATAAIAAMPNVVSTSIVQGAGLPAITTQGSRAAVLSQNTQGILHGIETPEAQVATTSPQQEINLGKDVLPSLTIGEATAQVSADETLTPEQKTQAITNYKNSLIEQPSVTSTITNQGLQGFVMVTVLFPESRASGPTDENWTPEQFQQTLGRITNSALGLVESHGTLNGTPLSFWVEWGPPTSEWMQLNREPSSLDHGTPWLLELMCEGLGRCISLFSDDGNLQADIALFNDGQMRAANENIKQANPQAALITQSYTAIVGKDELRPNYGDVSIFQRQTKYNCFLFFTCNTSDLNLWPHAEPGLYVVLPWILNTYDGGGSMALESVFAHESSHVFGAADEYTDADMGVDSGCDSADSAGSFTSVTSPKQRTRDAGAPAGTSNLNGESCAPPGNYTPDSLLKNTTWLSTPVVNAPDGLPVFDWHTKAQIGWGDTNEIVLDILNPYFVASGLTTGNLRIYLDGILVREINPHWNLPWLQDQPLFRDSYKTTKTRLNIAPGSHNLKVVGATNNIANISDKLDGTIPVIVSNNGSGPGTNNGVTNVSITLGKACSDGTLPHQCSAMGNFCTGSEIKLKSCLCGCWNFGKVCNTASNQCVTCNGNSDCNDGNSCTTDTCSNPGTQTSACSNPLIPSDCGSAQCGSSSNGCYQCGPNSGNCAANYTCDTSTKKCLKNCTDSIGSYASGTCNNNEQLCTDGVFTQKDCRACGCPPGKGCSLTTTGQYMCKCTLVPGTPPCLKPGNINNLCCRKPEL